MQRPGELGRGALEVHEERRGGVLGQRHAIAELRGVPPRALDAAGCGHAGQDDRVDAVLAQVQIEVGVGETARPPVLLIAQ